MYILSQQPFIFRKQSHRTNCFPHASRWCTPMNPPYTIQWGLISPNVIPRKSVDMIASKLCQLYLDKVTLVLSEWILHVYLSGGCYISPWFSINHPFESHIILSLFEGNLEAKLPTIWTDGKESEKRKGQKKEDQRRERVRRKKMQVCEKAEKSRNTVFFLCFGRKVGSLKRRVRSHLGRWEMKNCTPLWREADFEVSQKAINTSRSTFEISDVQKVYIVVAQNTFRSQSVKNWRVRSTFGSWDVGKVHGVVARRTFRNQIAQNTSASEQFWRLRCWKSASRCGKKHIYHFEVKMRDTHHVRTSFGHWDVEKMHAVAAGSTYRSQNVKNTSRSDHL